MKDVKDITQIMFPDRRDDRVLIALF